jgi:hypothetical protein
MCARLWAAVDHRRLISSVELAVARAARACARCGAREKNAAREGKWRRQGGAELLWLENGEGAHSWGPRTAKCRRQAEHGDHGAACPYRGLDATRACKSGRGKKVDERAGRLWPVSRNGGGSPLRGESDFPNFIFKQISNNSF